LSAAVGVFLFRAGRSDDPLCDGTASLVTPHLRQFYAERVELQREHQLIDSGPYATVRHPVFTSFFLFAGGLLLINPALPSALVFAYTLWDFSRAGGLKKPCCALLCRLYGIYGPYRGFFPAANILARRESAWNIDLQTFLQLPQAEFSALVAESGPLVAVFPINGRGAGICSNAWRVRSMRSGNPTCRLWKSATSPCIVCFLNRVFTHY
jgi:hypothetical protein